MLPMILSKERSLGIFHSLEIPLYVVYSSVGTFKYVKS